MEYVVWSRGERIAFASELTPEKSIHILENSEKPSGFSVSLVSQYKDRGLSERQIAWLIKLAQDEVDRLAAVVKGGVYKPVIDLFNSIPMARFQVRLNEFTLKKAGATSRNIGSVYLFESNAYKGKITPEGVLRACGLSNESQQQLDAFALNPVETIVKHGIETGQCSCCGRPLSDPISVHGGIGPVCLERIAGKQARKIMQESFVESDNLIERLAKAGLLILPKTKPEERDGCLPPVQRGEFQSEHDFQLANVIGKL